MEKSKVLSKGQDFLLLNYANMGFFVNRNQFSGSTSINKIRKIESHIVFINKIFNFNDQTILLFDCDDFLQQVYNCNNENKSQLCLLMRMENFSSQIRPLITRVLTQSPKLSKEYFGLLITGQSEIKKMDIEDIYLSPRGVRKHFNKYGLYGCCFPEDDSIQYFIDLEIIILNAIKGRRM